MPTENNNQHELRVDPAVILDWFRSKWSDQECPICHEHSWRVETTGFRLERLTFVGQEVSGPPFLILIPVTCKNCSYTMLFDNNDIGAVKSYEAVDDE